MTALRIANVTLEAETGWRALTEYAAAAKATVHYYDFAGGVAPAPHNGVDLLDFGRLMFFGGQLAPDHAVALVEAAASADWASVPLDARLVDADPADDDRDRLYSTAESLYRHFLDADPRVGAADVSKLLHLNRPALFPILDATVRVLYSDRAADAWARSRQEVRPRSGRSYWPVIREDLLGATEHLAEWRSRLADTEDPLIGRLATLEDVRLWDIVVRALGVSIR